MWKVVLLDPETGRKLAADVVSVRDITNIGPLLPIGQSDRFVEGHGIPKIDLDSLARILGLPPDAPIATVHFDPVSGHLRLPGKPETRFTGHKQVAVVHELYLAWQRGSPDVKAEVLLAKAKAEAPSIAQLFRGRKDWKTYIASVKRGWYRLKI